MTPIMRRLWRLFSATPDLNPSNNGRVLFPLHGPPFPKLLVFAPHITVLILAVLAIERNLLWVFFILIYCVLVFSDYRCASRSISMKVVGHDEQGFFLIDRHNNDIKLELTGEVIVTGWFISICFVEHHSRIRRPLFAGAWNLNSKDFHAFRQFLVAA